MNGEVSHKRKAGSLTQRNKRCSKKQKQFMWATRRKRGKGNIQNLKWGDEMVDLN